MNRTCKVYFWGYMGFESNFGKQRKVLADSLKDIRSEGPDGKEKARELLETAKLSEAYRVNSELHQSARGIGEKFKKEAFKSAEDIPLHEGWREEDISMLIPERYKQLLDIVYLSEATDLEGQAIEKETGRYPDAQMEALERLFKLRFGRSPSDVHEYDAEGTHTINETVRAEIDAGIEKERNEAQQFWNTLTDGKFLDPHNLNHFLGAETSKEFKGPFDPHSKVQPGLNFWASAHGSSYAPLYGSQLIVLSPKNPAFRQFLKEGTYANPMGAGSNSEALLEAFLRGEELPVFGEQGSIHNWIGVGLREEYREKQKGEDGYSWMDIADCIVDLRAGKRWTRTYSKEEILNAESDMAAFVKDTK